ncbi:MAG: tetraacyldisaccharide 4'-kinase [Sulfurihydrogenibium sp.]|nr:tetraacyldisaccharide 4'-kinase [Sulfurihydrogenibium sp.]
MFRNLLYPLSAIYWTLASLRRFLYEKNIIKKKRLPKPVISVGNLSVGGTGKTPIAISISKYLQNQGFKVAVLSRGYKRKSKEEIIKCDNTLNAKSCGDEPFLMVKKGIDVFVGKDRYTSGMHALKIKDYDFFILDDGFQHFQLFRDFNILVVDAGKPFWKDKILPVGNLREPKSFYKYADVFLISRYKEQADVINKLKEFGKPFFITQERFDGLIDLDNNKIDFSFLKGKKVSVISGLGNNLQFFNLVKSLSKQYDFIVEEFINLPDHFDYKNFKFDLNKTYITTEKDLVKINQKNVYAVSYEILIPEEFYKFMMEKIHARAKSD